MPAKKKRKSPRIVKRYYRKNPDEGAAEAPSFGFGGEILWTVGPAIAAFAATRLLTRIAAVQISKRFPRAAPHAGALASIGTFAAAVIAGHKLPYVRDYQEPVIIGSGVAAAQSLIQIYIPKLGWVVSDASPDIAATQKRKAVAAQQQQVQRQIPKQTADPDYEDLDDAGWTSYNDAHDHGRYAAPVPDDRTKEPDTSADDTSEADQDIFDMLDNDSDLQAAGGWS